MRREFPPSVNVSLPPECEALIQRRIEDARTHGRTEVWTTVIHDALWHMRNRGKRREDLRQELEQALVDGINSGPPIPVTPSFWKNIRVQVRRRHKKIAAARAEGLVGNLLLPRELFMFIEEEIAAGRFRFATDLVIEALQTSPHPTT